MLKTIATKSLMGVASACLMTSAAFAVTADDVVGHYADIALAKYSDSLEAARTLDAAVDAFIADPSEMSLQAAKDAWLASRIPYQQTEVYRFGNAIVDDWEGRVNAWPLDEGLIDYVDSSYGMENDENGLYTANVIANASIEINGEMVDASDITPEFLSTTLHEAAGVEANVATGYHAVEFLLWGQDLNGSDAGAGNRPWSDYASGADCTNSNCDRRAAYLAAASNLLVADLEEMVGNWEMGGAARAELMADTGAGVSTILTGMGSLSYGELAGERMKLGLLLHDPEEEHDCFADNTHNSHLYDVVGINNVLHGRYIRTNGTVLEGASLAALIAEQDAAVAEELESKLAVTLDRMRAMASRATHVESYDQMIGEGNAEGNAVVQAAIDSLVDQTRSIERAVAALNVSAIEFEGSDSLDNPNAVFE